MSKIRRIVLIVLTVLLAFSSPTVTLACPNCKYSPYHWGFCHYLVPAGYYNCEEYVTDNFSGRTDCRLSGGECRWYSDGGEGGGPLPGPYYPGYEDYGALAPGLGKATAVASARPACSSWTDTPNELLAVF